MASDFLIIMPLRILPLPLVPPLGPISLRSYAMKCGFQGDILDFNTIIFEDNIDSYHEIIQARIADWITDNPEAKVVGISVLFSGVFPRAIEIARLIKRVKPAINVVFGGIHPTLHHREILENYEDVDLAVIGEGEERFVDILRCYVRGESSPDLLTNGVALRRNGEVVIRERTTYSDRRSINDFGVTAYDCVDYEKYHTPDMDSWYNPRNKPIVCAAPVLTSRSCPYVCNFCSIHAVHGPRSTFRYRSSDDILDELKFLYYEKGINYFYIVDDCANGNKRNALEIYSKIANSGMDISLEFQNGLRISALDEEVIDAMVAAGMVRGGLAIESGSEYIRNKVVGKMLHEDKIYEVCEYFGRRHPHVWLIAFFIIGLPEETEETLDDTARMIGKLDRVYPIINIAIPTPGTKLWNQCVADNLLLFPAENAWRECFVFGTDRSNLSWCMSELNLVSKTFVLQPYNLDLDTLHRRYRAFIDIGQERLKHIKFELLKFPIPRRTTIGYSP